jgi:hypothetical protein
MARLRSIHRHCHAVERRRRIGILGRWTARMGELTRRGRNVAQAWPLTRYYMRSKRLRRKQSSDQPLSVAQKGSPSQLRNENISFWLVLSFYS